MDLQAQQGLMTTYREAWRTRGAPAWVASGLLVACYCILYWTDWLDGPAAAIGLRNKWFLYGLIYTLVMSAGAVVYLRAHGNSRYNQLRIAVNVGIQIVLGFTLPFVMPLLGQPEFYFSYFWPLKYDYLFPDTLHSLPLYLSLYTILGTFVLAPVASLLWGKRWYCSWVCGCGALANTFGDPWRHLTEPSTRAWRFEKIAVHSVLGLAVLLLAVAVGGQMLDYKSAWFAPFSHTVKSWYGFVIGSVLAGVVGTGLYPLLGPRLWCRNFCPMAALLGILQKAGRFRIRVKPDMCISCGNCTTYCEMGIDVRSYAQSNQSFTRASCVGCGMCAHVCPRGVLKLENHWERPSDKQRQGLSTVDF